MIRRRAGIDWHLVGCAVRAQLFFDRLQGVPHPVRRAVARTGLSRTTFWRASRGERVVPAHFLRLCAWLGWKPRRFERGYWDAELARCRARRTGGAGAGQGRRAA